MDQEKSSKTSSFILDYTAAVLTESTIHGVKYIGLPNRHIVERFERTIIFWIFSVIALTGYSFYLVEEVYSKYIGNPVIISFQPKETDIARVPFPAITICNVNILKREMILDVVTNLIHEIDNKVENVTRLQYLESLVMSEHLAHHCKAAPSFRRRVSAKLVDPLGEDDFVDAIHSYLEQVEWDLMSWSQDEMSDELKSNLTGFLKHAAHGCDDMILKCMWARKELPCSDIFSDVHTQYGSCCVFNMLPEYILRKMPENDSRAIEQKGKLKKAAIREWKAFGKSGKIVDLEDEESNDTYPRRQKSGGKPYGLSILLNPEVDKYSTCSAYDSWGFKMVAHSPISFPEIMEYGAAVPPGSEVFVDVKPEISTAEKELRKIPIDKRGCYFPQDKEAKLKSYKFYASSNCISECYARLTYENCSCVRYFMPKNATQKLCGAKDLDCVDMVRESFTSSTKISECSACRPACTEIKYKMQLSHFPLRESNGSTFFYNTSDGIMNGVNNYSIVHIFIGTDKINAKERKRLYDMSDLLANAGGLLSLTLGISIVSFVELIYFCTLRIWFYWRDRKLKDDEKVGIKGPAIATIVKPRILDGIPITRDKLMLMEYYNWAITTSNAAKVMVKPVASESVGAPKKKALGSHFPKGQTSDHIYPYPYLS